MSRWTVLLLVLSAAAPLRAEEVSSVADAFRLGRADLGLRWRFEQVDDGRFPPDAQASTLRATLAASTGRYRGFALDLELESVLDVGFANDHVDGAPPGLSNGVSGRPAIVDPSITSLQRAKLSWRSRDERTELAAGRDEIVLGDERFLGPVGWRQHHQAFDALQLRTTAIPKTTLRAIWIDKVERVTGGDLPMSSLVVASDTSLPGGLTLSLVGLELDLDRPADSGLSSRTLVAGLAGRHQLEALQLDWRVRAGEQEDAGSNPNSIDASYREARLGVTRGPIGITLGWEQLGATAGRGRFQTPLATLHAFNGWVDLFLNTPEDGLDDRFLRATGSHGVWSWDVRLHDFHADLGGRRYGRELDAQLAWKGAAGLSLIAKGAHFESDGFAADVTKLWLVASTSIAIGR